MFDYGEAVRISARAGAEFRPGELASVCGIFDDSAEPNGFPRGTVMSLIEYGDGATTEVPAIFLDKYTA